MQVNYSSIAVACFAGVDQSSIQGRSEPPEWRISIGDSDGFVGWSKSVGSWETTGNSQIPAPPFEAQLLSNRPCIPKAHPSKIAFYAQYDFRSGYSGGILDGFDNAEVAKAVIPSAHKGLVAEQALYPEIDV